MAEKKFDEKKHYKKIDNEYKTIRTYLAKIKDRNYAAIKEANESIKYDFNELAYEDTQKKYGDAIYKHISDKIKKEYKIGEIDDSILETLIKQLGGITAKEISDMVKGKGDNLEHKDIAQLLGKSENMFAQSHFVNLGTKYTNNEDEKKATLDYLGLKDKVDYKQVTNEHFPTMFYHRGATGQVDLSQLDPKVLLSKTKKRDDKKKKK